MKKSVEYIAKGTCSRRIFVTLNDDVIEEVRFEGGCAGNTQGVSQLVKGMNAHEAIER